MATQNIAAKLKKKKWFGILASKEFDNLPIGETLSTDGANLVGKTIKISLMNLTNNPKNQSVNIGFKVNEVKDDDVLTSMISYSVSQSHLRRMIRPAKSKIDDSFVCNTKDSVNVRIKILLLTKKIVKSSISAALKHKAREFITEYSKGSDYSNTVYDLINGKLQKDLKDGLNKIYPLTLCQIRAFERIK